MPKKFVFFDGVFWGGLLGGIAGLLVAPFSGSVTRKKLSKFNPVEIKNEYVNPAIEAIDRGISKLDEALEEGRLAMDEKRKELGNKGGKNADITNT